MGGSWLAKDPDQAISLIILIGALFAIFFGLGSLRSLRRVAAPVRRAQERPEPALGPPPVLWDVHCRALAAGKWEGHQPLSVQARGLGLPSSVQPTVASRDADVMFLIAMPVPSVSRPSSVLAHQPVCVDPDKVGTFAMQEQETMPYVAIGTTATRTPSSITFPRSRALG